MKEAWLYVYSLTAKFDDVNSTILKKNYFTSKTNPLMIHVQYILIIPCSWANVLMSNDRRNLRNQKDKPTRNLDLSKVVIRQSFQTSINHNNPLKKFIYQVVKKWKQKVNKYCVCARLCVSTLNYIIVCMVYIMNSISINIIK